MKDSLIIKYLLGESDEAEGKVIREWVQEDPQHQKRFDQIKWIWKESIKLNNSNELNENEAWDRFLSRRDGSSAKSNSNISLFPRQWLKVAASITVLISLMAGFLLLKPHAGRGYFTSVKLNSEDISMNEHLLDGSTITLNKKTQLSYSQKLFSGQRLVNMEKGEAYFEVTRDQSRPFIIKMEKVTIEVLGTSFHVKKDQHLTEVIVDSGSVEVSSGNQQFILSPGEKLKVDPIQGTFEKSIQNNELFRYYVDQKFHAVDIPLELLIEALNNAYGSAISISPQLSKKSITTTLNYGSLDENLEVIKETFDLTIIKDGNQIFLQ